MTEIAHRLYTLDGDDASIAASASMVRHEARRFGLGMRRRAAQSAAPFIDQHRPRPTTPHPRYSPLDGILSVARVLPLLGVNQTDPNRPVSVEDRRGRGAVRAEWAGWSAAGRRITSLIAALLSGRPRRALDTTSQPPIEGAQSQTLQECRTGADANKRADCRVVGFVDSVQKYWDGEFNRRAATYSPATTVIFTSYVEAACGTASGAMGPFYCPTDKKVYLDTSFFDDLRRSRAKGGTFAVGYERASTPPRQTELGLTPARVTRSCARAEGDCISGVWAKRAARVPAAPTEPRSRRRSMRLPRSETTASSSKRRAG